MKKMTTMTLLLVLAGCTPADFEPKLEPVEPAPIVYTSPQFFVTIEVKQSHFTIDPFEMMKDNMNAIEIEIAVSEEYYNAVEVGTVIDDSFRMGSFVFGNSIGNWDVTVIKKEIK